jgi:hypothetical protein
MFRKDGAPVREAEHFAHQVEQELPPGSRKLGR